MIRFLPDAKVASLPLHYSPSSFTLTSFQSYRSLAWIVAYLMFHSPNLPSEVQWYSKTTVSDIMLARNLFLDWLLHQDACLRHQPNSFWTTSLNNFPSQTLYNVLSHHTFQSIGPNNIGPAKRDK
jgi:hypothetical protein